MQANNNKHEKHTLKQYIKHLSNLNKFYQSKIINNLFGINIDLIETE